jgi:hypothetical protein
MGMACAHGQVIAVAWTMGTATSKPIPPALIEPAERRLRGRPFPVLAYCDL